jgi:DNA-binding transcriptional ArsR family regulator
MADLTPKRLLVLRELAYLSTTCAGDGDGWLRAYHVRYFRGVDSLLFNSTTSMGSAEEHLRRLYKDGYLDKKQREQSYRINDKGRSALEES